MTPFILYLLKANGLLAIVFVFYYLLLRKETFFVAIRYYFLLGITLSLLLPLLQLTKTVYVEQTLDWARLLSQASNDAMIEQPQSFVERFDLMTWIPYVFGGLTVVISVLFSGKVLRLIRHVKRLPRWQSKSEIKVDTTTKEAYSFWKWIVLPVNHQDIPALETIIQHEQIHVQQKHTVDLLVIHLLRRIFWFNPFLLLLEQAIRLNLEYIVDQKVTNQQNSYDYQLALVQFEQTKTTSFTLVNSFRASDLKKRIIMLNQPKSKTMRKSKFILCLPLAVGFFLLFQLKTQAEVRLVEQELNQTEQEPEKKQNQPKVNVSTFGTTVTDNHTAALAQEEEGVPVEMGMKIADEGEAYMMVTSGTGKMKMVMNGKEITEEELEKYKVNSGTTGKSETYVIHSSGSGSNVASKFIINGKEYSMDDLDLLEQNGVVTKNTYSFTVDNDKLSDDVKRQIEEAKKAVEDTKKVREEALKASRAALEASKEDREKAIKASKKALEESKQARQEAIDASIKALEASRKAMLEKREEAKRDAFIVTSDSDNAQRIDTRGKTIAVRHLNEVPLYTVDGNVLEDLNELKSIKPEEIKSINVLKGKEAKEKYGKVGENGVIEINRKK